MPQVQKNFIFQRPLTGHDHQQWMDQQVATGKVVQFIIMVGGHPVGSTFLRDIDTTHRKAEFGIFIGDMEFHGKGVGTRATRLILDYAFSYLNLHRVYLRVLKNNTGAIKSYEKAGFLHEGVLRQDVYLGDGYHDVIWMGVLNSISNEALL